MIEDRAGKAQTLLLELLFNNADPERPADMILVTGLTVKMAFHPGRVEEAKPRIEELLQGLPPEFYEKGGGGWSFLNLCNDADGHQWGEHSNMEAVCILAIAAGLGKFFLLDQIEKLPGGVPYFVIHGEVR